MAIKLGIGSKWISCEIISKLPKPITRVLIILSTTRAIVHPKNLNFRIDSDHITVALINKMVVVGKIAGCDRIELSIVWEHINGG